MGNQQGKSQRARRILAFDLAPGRVLAKKYAVISRLGAGWEGEVYLVRELATGILRTAKFFFPHRNLRNRNLRFYAKKLHKLRQCPIVIQYHTQETIVYRRQTINFLVSEYVQGELLGKFLARQPDRRLSAFQAVHLLHAMARGLECIHRLGEYHGDLHPDNIIVQRYGLGFELKLLDLFHWDAPRAENIQNDVIDCVKIFYDALGGQKAYADQPPVIKAICRGLKRSLILKNFRTAPQLRAYLETLQWS